VCDDNRTTRRVREGVGIFGCQSREYKYTGKAVIVAGGVESKVRIVTRSGECGYEGTQAPSTS